MASETTVSATSPLGVHSPEATEQPSKKANAIKEAPSLREAGDKTTFPLARVQRIIKADKEMPTVVREAQFLIALAAEEFLKKYSEAVYNLASRDRRTTVQYKDNATLVRKADEFLFLEEITPWVEPNPPAKRKPKIYEHKESGPQGVTMMDQFVSAKDATEAEETPDYGQEALVNEDGTMQMEW